MSGHKVVCAGVVFLGALIGRAQAQHGGMHRASWHGPHGGGGYSVHHGQSPQFVGFGVGGFYGGFSPILVIGPGGFFPPLGWMGPSVMPNAGPLLPPPPPEIFAPRRDRNRAVVKPGDAARSKQLTTLGDRLFRAGNLKKAEERYTQAMRAALDLALPRVRLAQIAIVRGQYAAAAERFREAETAQPGWIATAPDIQALYGEPDDFASNLARLESHLQVNPDDRDAWLVLGAEWFLSGRTTKAVDVFKRLNDPNRKPDVALAAFLDASNQAQRNPVQPPVPDPPNP